MNYRVWILCFSVILFNVCSKAQEWIPAAQGILPVNYFVNAVSVVNENIIWACARDNEANPPIAADYLTYVLKSTDGGNSWDIFPVEESMGRLSFDIEAINEDVAFISSNNLNSSAGRGIFKTSDGGITWNEVLPSSAGGVWIRFFNELEGVAINRESMATTNDGGETWIDVPQANIPPFAVDEFTIIINGNNSCVTKDDHIWFGTNEGRVFYSNNKGLSWNVSDLGTSNGSIIISVAFEDTLNGLALNLNGFPKILRTSDGGQNWSSAQTSVSLIGTSLVSIPNSPGAYLMNAPHVGNSFDFFSLYSTDFGENWTLFYSGNPFTGCEFISESTGWVGTGVITSKNDPALRKWNSDFFVSTEEQTVFEYKVYPNPFSNSLFVETPNQGNEIQQIQLIDNAGRLLKQYENLERSDLDIGDLPLGVYYLKIITEKGTYLEQLIKAN